MNNCKISEKCGGCYYMSKPYDVQLKTKTEYVKKMLSGIDKNIKVYPTIGMKNPFNYRNKGKYALKNGKMGFFEEGTHKIIFGKCIIQNDIINQIAEYIFELVKKYHISIYNEDTRKGFLRYVVVRYAVNTDEVMIIFVTTEGKMFKKNEIVKNICEKFKNVKSIVQNINNKDTNAILGSKVYLMYGNEFITDKIKINTISKVKNNVLKNSEIDSENEINLNLNELSFKISPLSFYQINTEQMQVLYSKAIEFAQLDENQIAYDLYSGIGTISLCIAKNCSKVYGIEIVKDAVKDAIENSKINHTTNARFMAGKVEELLPKLCSKEKADVVFIDPPRSGLDKKTIDTLLKVKPKKIIYISCNPETLAINLKQLKKDYKISKIQPIDMFPFTKHVESITLLILKD